MDVSTIIGILGAFVIVGISNILEGGNPMSMFLLPPMLLVWGGTIMVSIAGGTLADAKALPGSLIKAFTGKPAVSADVVPVVGSFYLLAALAPLLRTT